MSTTFNKPPHHPVSRDIISGGQRIKMSIDSISATDLKAVLLAEQTKPDKSKAKIRFIDCQSDNDHLKQIAGAIHMNLVSDTAAQAVFKSNIKNVQSIVDYLAAADMVVIYCSQAIARSPQTVVEYNKNISAWKTHKPAQIVLLLDGGIKAYSATGGPLVQDYLSVKNGKKPTPDVPKPGNVKPPQALQPTAAQPGQVPKNLVEENWTLYTDSSFSY